MSVRVKGLQNVQRALRATREVADGKLLMGKLLIETRAMAADIQAAAQELAPVEEGTLRGEARHTATIGPSASIEASVYFGGLATQYASVQHEHEEFRHPMGGTHHFLYGETHSAWNPATARAWASVLDRECGRIADAHIAAAAGGR